MKKYFQDLQIYRDTSVQRHSLHSQQRERSFKFCRPIPITFRGALISRVLSSLQISISEQVFYDSNPNKKIKNCLSVHFPYFLMDHFSRISRYIFESFYFSLVQSGTVTVTADFFTCDYEHLQIFFENYVTFFCVFLQTLRFGRPLSSR